MKIRADRDRSLVDFIFGQLERIPELRFRRMFGAYGIYAGELFFAIVDEGKLYFRTDEQTRAPYLEAGMEPLKDSQGEVILKNYYQVPVDIIEDGEALERWAKTALSISTPPKPRKRRRNPG